jgi:hypothetical protein
MAPHTNDPVVAGLMLMFSSVEQLAYWSMMSMVDLRNSVIRDMEEGRLFAWQTRIRQVEEIYFKALYSAFFATPEELPHILSGAMPNSVVPIYRKVNDEILKGSGEWEVSKPGLTSVQFTPLSILHSAAHASYAAMMTAISCARQPEQLAVMQEKFIKHLNTYCDRLEYMYKMFAAGRDKQTVLDAFISMHRR